MQRADHHQRPPVEDRASHSLCGFERAAVSSAIIFSSNAVREYGAWTECNVVTGALQVYHAIDRDVGNLEFCGANNEYVGWTESVD